MRMIYRYRLIRYFPHTLSDEFLNIGVIVNGISASAYRILSSDEAKHLYCTALIGEKKRLTGVLEYLHELAQKDLLLDHEHYFHNFRFSQERKIASEKNAQEIVNELFQDYIGFKLHIEEKKEQKEIILEKSIRLIEKEFRDYVQIRKTNLFDFEIENIHRHIVHHSNLGRSSWKHDASEMVMNAPLHRLDNERFDFLDITGKIDPQSRYVQKMKQNYVDIYPYKTEQQIGDYLELVAGAA